VSYQPLAGVKVLDLGILIPAALTSGKLAALGADVVKVEQPPGGDRVRAVPPFADDGQSPQHMGQNWGKRSIGLDVRHPDGRQTILALAGRADVIIENQLAGFWAGQGVDFAALRQERPALVVCSVTGFGQTGPWASLPSHGLNMDALGDTLNIEWEGGQPRRGWTFTSWGNELGTAFATTAILAALLSARSTGEGAWIDLSCWDALVESHRTEIALSTRTKQPVSMHQPRRQALYDAYLSSDGVPVLLGALELKFWTRFCDRIGRSDLVARHPGVALAFGDDDEDLRGELEQEFRKATAAEWLDRFLAWDVPGGPVLDVPRIMETDHFAARQIAAGAHGDWPNIATAIRWHHVDERAGAGLARPPAFDQHHDEVLRDWLE
jgi:crotonobetainyl-CoA:carnitine CoA-transferase CaiB-like acyl-CoA transferase